jgi:hypothetical protein
MDMHFIFNESLITRARNYCADAFMRSDCSHMLFIDSDIGFSHEHVLTLLALMSDESPYDVLCAPYPKKNISWEKIVQGVNKGFADSNPNNLDKLVGDFVFNPVLPDGASSGPIQMSLTEPAEVLESGTGFMMVRRKTFETFRAARPELMYRPDHARSDDFDGSRSIMMYFQAELDVPNYAQIYKDALEDIIRYDGEMHPDKALGDARIRAEDAFRLVEELDKKASRRYLSEDYKFCQDVRRLGMKVWLCPWMELSHVGSYIYSGSMIAMAQVGASPTADMQELVKTKKLRKVEEIVK